MTIYFIKIVWKVGFQFMLILGLLGMYFDVAVVFVTKSSLFFRLAVAILWKLKLNSIIFDTLNGQWNREWERFIGILNFGPDRSINIYHKNELLLILPPQNFLTFHRACINTSCHYIYGSLFSICLYIYIYLQSTYEKVHRRII